uniref:Uncharacterized protein n=1 Tax=Timema monikensis TaxID=170555 RepID=A0A7R9EF24_9NEOP|nr:unnamed protein product [Timema monikensis]
MERESPCGVPLLRPQRQVAMISEMIHSASLIHDDVIDQSDFRRGKPSVNVLWNHKKTSARVGSGDGEAEYQHHLVWSSDGEANYQHHLVCSGDGEAEYQHHLVWSSDGEANYQHHLVCFGDGEAEYQHHLVWSSDGEA